MSARAPVQRPNILFITCDTLRRDALGCTGNRIVRTPHIDRLAARGAVFRNAYTPSPLCMPARASLISGLYPHQHGIYANRCEPLSGPQRELTFASVLRRAGYDTAFVGRHHFYDFWETPGFDYRTLQDEVRRYGFDHVVQVNDKPEHAHLECDYTAYLRGKGLLEAYRAELGRGGIAPFETISEEDHHDSFAAREAQRWLDGRAPAGAGSGPARPFLLWLSLGGPHPPYRSVGPYGRLYRPEEMPRPVFNDDPAQAAQVQREYAQYYGMITQIDGLVGRVLDDLESRGELGRTLVILTSDHGDMLGDHGLHHKRRFYEQSVGVPVVMAGPGVPGSLARGRPVRTPSPVLVETLDVFPTVLEAASIPRGDAPATPGRSLFAALDGPRDWRRAVFSELGTWSMVRTASWKLTYDPEQGGVQHLFNLVADPQEGHNLAGAPPYAAVEAELTRMLLDWFVCTTTRTGDVERQQFQRVVAGH